MNLQWMIDGTKNILILVLYTIVVVQLTLHWAIGIRNDTIHELVVMSNLMEVRIQNLHEKLTLVEAERLQLLGLVQEAE